MRILTIDPGKSTGVAWTYGDEVYYEEIPGGLEEFVRWFHEDDIGSTLDVIVIENWTVRPNTYRLTPEPDAYLIIGYVQGWCALNNMTFAKVEPGTHKKLCGKGRQSKVVRLGWGQRTTDGHADDACSIMLIALKKLDPERFRDLMRGIATNV